MQNDNVKCFLYLTLAPITVFIVQDFSQTTLYFEAVLINNKTNSGCFKILYCHWKQYIFYIYNIILAIGITAGVVLF